MDQEHENSPATLCPTYRVMSPQFFLIYIIDLITKVPYGTKVATYTDDLVTGCTNDQAIVITKILHRAIDAINLWAN